MYEKDIINNLPSDDDWIDLRSCMVNIVYSE